MGGRQEIGRRSMFEGNAAQLQCSFCGRPEEQVEQLVVGVLVTICERCIATCAETVLQRRQKRPAAPTPAFAVN